MNSVVTVLAMVETKKEERKGGKKGDRKGGREVWQEALTKAESFTSKLLLDS